MTPASKQQGTRHVVVTLDVSERGRPALETAVRLAAITGAHLEGVFVEDINLIRLAGLPFLRELRPSSLAEEAISAQRLQRELRSLARQARRMLEQVAGEMGVPCSFQVWRGQAVAETLAEVFTADILSLAQVSSRVAQRGRSISRPRTRRHPQAVTTISILFSESKAAVRALTTACILASDLEAEIAVLIPYDRKATRKKLRQKAKAALASYEQSARFIQLSETGLQPLVEAIVLGGPNILIAESGNFLLQEAGLDQCLDKLACPILLVR